MRRHRAALALVSILHFACAVAHAQSEDGAQPGYTLHVYANRLQVPVLVLDAAGTPMKNLPRKRFAISLDGGPPFEPVSAHVQGDDAITLAIIIDASGEQKSMIGPFADAFLNARNANALKPRDHVFLWALDCQLARTLTDAPADGAMIQKAVHLATDTPALHGDKPKHNCAHSLHLLDTIAKAAIAISDLPGRRIILVLSEGIDHGSNIKEDDLRGFLTDRSIALFAMRDSGTNMGYSSLAHPLGARPEASLLDRLASASGGVVFNCWPTQVADRIADFTRDVRSRYILEFPRPNESTAGEHGIDVTLPSVPAIGLIRTAGVSAPVADPDDPNAIHASQSDAKYGAKRPKK